MANLCGLISIRGSKKVERHVKNIPVANVIAKAIRRVLYDMLIASST